MNSIESITLEVADPAAAQRFYTTAFGLDSQLRLRASEAPTTGFRGFTLSLIVAQPSTAKGFIDAALDAGATSLKPAAKSFWGYGGVVQAPDGTIWKIASSAKKDKGPATRQIDQMVLLIGASDVAATKKFYVDRGLAVAKSYGRKYVEFDAPPNSIKLGLYGHRALAKDAGVPPEGTGSHRLLIGNDDGAFTDPDGFEWVAAYYSSPFSRTRIPDVRRARGRLLRVLRTSRVARCGAPRTPSVRGRPWPRMARPDGPMRGRMWRIRGPLPRPAS